ncbi:uncharacterized protein [Drosophila takahashii]|uniref:uncharacterized protein n=1 Tax=Drosophila takahashii TaxID=29030 RepID=UPI003898E357
MVVTVGGALPQKKTGRVAPKSTPLAGKTRSVGVKRAAAGALTSLSGPLANSLGPGLVNGMDRDGGLPQQIASAKVPVPPPRPPYRRAGAAAAAASAAAASAAAKFAAKVPGAPIVGAVVSPSAGSSNLTLPSSAAIKKSSLASSRKVGGGKSPDPQSIKRRVKFSANVHTYPSVTSTKKSARIGELQLKKKVKKLKRIRSRREGGSGGTASELLNSSGITTSNQDINKHGTIVDVKPPAQPRILRLNVVGKSSPATGKSALATALLRKAKRSAEQEKLKESETATGTGGGRIGKAKAKASSSHLVERSAGLAARKKPATTGTTGIQRRVLTQPQNGRRIHGKV